MVKIFKRNVTTEASDSELTLNMHARGRALFNNLNSTVVMRRPRFPPGRGGSGVFKKKSHRELLEKNSHRELLEKKLLELKQGFIKLEFNILHDLKSRVHVATDSLLDEKDFSYLKSESDQNPYFVNLTTLVDTKIVLFSKEVSFEISNSAKKVFSSIHPKIDLLKIQPLEDQTTKIVDELFFNLSDTFLDFSGNLYSDVIRKMRLFRHHMDYNVGKQPCLFTVEDQKILDQM
jgi:hypothetical protein